MVATRSFGSGQICLHVSRPLKMTDKTYLVRFKPRGIGLQVVIPASAEFHGEHIVLLDSKACWPLCS